MRWGFTFLCLHALFFGSERGSIRQCFPVRKNVPHTLVVHDMIFRLFTGVAGGSLAGHCLALSDGHATLLSVCFCTVYPMYLPHSMQDLFSSTQPSDLPSSPHLTFLLPFHQPYLRLTLPCLHIWSWISAFSSLPAPSAHSHCP